MQIIACTGFHRRKYYPPGHWLFSAGSEKAAGYFSGELAARPWTKPADRPSPSAAGFIKIALENAWTTRRSAALEGAAAAAQQTGALVEIHTEKGALAEKAAIYFEDQGVRPEQLVLCHMDKRPDLGLHAELAARRAAGIRHLLPAQVRAGDQPMAADREDGRGGLSHQVALATDMAEAGLYRTHRRRTGLASLPGEIKPGLTSYGNTRNRSGRCWAAISPGAWPD